MTPELLRAATGCTAANAERFAAQMSAACAFYGIDTPVRLAAFLAQIGHESGSLRYVSELWGPTPAQARYEGRADLGNTQPGDGARFKGHGLIQTTGRYNHARVRDRLRERFPNVPDFEADPEALTDPQWAALSAADYWDDRGLNSLADIGEFEVITRKINGGLNGYADRVARWKRAQAALAAPATETITVAADGSAASVTTPKEATMPTIREVIDNPLTKFALAAINPLLAAVPELAKLFMDKDGTTVPERNVAAAVKIVTMAQDAMKSAGIEAPNAQAVAEAVTNDPAAREVVREVLMANYFELTESGGGGIDGARKADAAAVAGGSMLQSPSFWVAVALLPLVYMIVGSVVGLFGAPWSDDVRSAIANGVVGMVLGSIAGYYFGQTTSRNRTPQP